MSGLKALPVVCENFYQGKDGTISFKTYLNEVSHEELVFILGMMRKNAYMFLSEVQADFTEERIIEAMPDENRFSRPTKKKNSKSLNLRNKLFKLHKAKGGEDSEFEQFYESMMDKICEHYDGKANEELNKTC